MHHAHALQVEGKNGWPALKEKFRLKGFPVFFHGAIAASVRRWMG